jgi:CubicO group peptidase (beta-lactamase class C family)
MAGPKRKPWRIIVGILIVLNIVLFATGKGYYYKALLYNYVNIDDLDLFSVRKVEAGKPQPWNVASDFNRMQLTPELRKALEQYRTVAFLVIKDDSVRYEEYWDGYSQDSWSNSFSVAKSFIGTLTGIAIAEGKIKSIDDPACNYIPWFCEGKEKEITIRHLLMMSSGIDWDEGYTSLTSPVTRLYYDNHLDEQMRELPMGIDPGKEFNYMSCNTQLLAFVIQNATGKSVSQYASEKLWKPMGAEKDAFWSLDDKDGMEKAYCCFYTKARDFARLGKLFLQKGSWNGQQLVPEWYVNESITATPIDNNGTPNKIYGYQWWITSVRGEKVFYARGILGQYIIVIPSQNIIFVRLGHDRGEKGPDGELLDVPVYLEEVMKMFAREAVPATDSIMPKLPA